MVNYDGLYNKEYFGDRLNADHFVKKQLHFRIIENATILPFKQIEGAGYFGGLVDSEDKFVEGTQIHRGVGGGAYTPNDNVPYVNAPVIYLGMFIHVWGHCLTDNLKRLWFLKSHVYKKIFSKMPVLYTPMWGG